MRADNTSVTPNGRPSIRIESKELYNSSRLFIFDLNHMPTGCGTWAAYWFRGEFLPKDGEFDILEGTNKQTKNDINVHTGQNCFMNSTQQIMTGEAALHNANCNVNSTGCNVHSQRTDSYGAGLNKNQGGIYAMRWNDETGVQVWFFPRHQHIPSNIYSSSPQPETWGTPVADYPFGRTCSPSNFKNMRIIINLTFCGRWAGSKSTFGGAYHCPGNCTTFVENNPHAFSEAYWDINSLKVYKKKVTK
ncbi:MAG: concanavalin A-like lectin/glucanase domain-containing protein [Benjaminiella poitrasii]|nr:MAG: concanavalin A-like lectin/glucanase domain-containing protein [Benjaminiella poitrasii]